MTEATWKMVLEATDGKLEADGRFVLPDGRALTLYGAHGGVGLTVGKVVSVRKDGGFVHAQNAKGELFFLALEDLFAAAIEGGAATSSARKAGFMTGA
jgi:hypothetical protein